ncbi:MAG: AAA family ATPase [Verrucomicrobiae bacterium]|nr:AAA family ATPase [Verrucomicrobiae bacterium]
MASSDSLRQALRVSPDNAPLQLLFAQACLDEFNFDEARTAYEQVLRLDPAHREAHLGLARYLYLTGKTSEAVIRVETLTRAHPDFVAAWLLLARLAMAEASPHQALAHFQKAQCLDPTVRDEALEKELRNLIPPDSGPPPGALTQIPIPPHPAGEDPQNGTGENATDFDDPLARKAVFNPGGSTEVERPSINFSDIGGMESIKEEIRMKIIHPLRNPEIFRAYGKKAGGGVLLYGPPGCGKTLISRATAGEIKTNFISIGIHQILDMYIGNSEKAMHQIFELARENSPSVLFFDEVDALAADRADLRQSAGRNLINQFLAEMDGNIGSNEGILIIGATNAPWHIDPAFRRPGRFDRILFVPPPDEPSRRAILEVVLRGKPVEKMDLEAIVKKTRDFSGADLKHLVDLAVEKNLPRAMKEGRVLPISTGDILDVLRTVKPTTRAWFETAKNYAIYANQGGFYDHVLEFLGIKK